MNLIDLFVEYHKLRTYSPEIYAKHVTFSILGHSFGQESFNGYLPPRGVIHNSYLCLIGKSTISKKTTVQDETIGALIPPEFKGPQSFSPEGLLKEMSNIPQLICPMGEFSTVLRSIKFGGNMANFKEIANDLFTKKDVYIKQLVNAPYRIERPYLSMITTCTEEEFFNNLTPDMVHGGFLPRWLLVKAEPPQRKRIKVPDDIDKIESELKKLILGFYVIFMEHPLKFQLSKEADDLFYDIQCQIEDDSKFENVKPFAGRYLNYIAKYADIIAFSNKLSSLSLITNITSLSSLTSALGNISNELLHVTQNKLCKNVNGVNLLIQQYELQEAIDLVLPCLEYAEKVVKYVDEDILISKVLRVLDGHEKMDHSDVLRRTHLISEQFNKVMLTLSERKEWQTIVDGGKKVIQRWK